MLVGGGYHGSENIDENIASANENVIIRRPAAGHTWRQ